MSRHLSKAHLGIGEADLTGWIRVIADRHMNGPGCWPLVSVGSRFPDPKHNCQVLYFAQRLQTAIAETSIRDRKTDAEVLDLPRGNIWPYRAVSIKAANKLQLLICADMVLSRLTSNLDKFADLRMRLTGALTGRPRQQGGHRGILYHSRLDIGDCAVVFERAFPKRRSRAK